MKVRYALGLLSVCLAACSSSHQSSDLSDKDNSSIVYGDQVKEDNVLAKQVILLLLEKSACTGVMIAPDVVLTAAHCVADEDLEKVYAVFGTSAACVMSGSCTNTKIESAVIHPQYAIAREYAELRAQALRDEDQEAYEEIPDLKWHEVDVALVKLPTQAPTDYQIFEQFGFPKSDADKAVQIGFGATSSTRSQDNLLRYLYAKERDLTQISKAEGHSMLVVEQPDGGVCHGDSGGPLIVSNGSEVTVAGLVSAGFGNRSDQMCEGSAYYVSLEEHVDWIKTTLQGL